jgi:hypothetical protein
MSPATWVRRQLDRPIADTERRAAFTAITVVLVAAALLLAMTSTGEHGGRRTPDARGSASTARTSPPAPPATSALRTARRFLHGYLAFAYGHGPANAVRETTRSLTATLTKRARPVPPALRALQPRVLALRANHASQGAVVVTALVKDGEVVEYPLKVVLVLHGGSYLVAGLGRR